MVVVVVDGKAEPESGAVDEKEEELGGVKEEEEKKKISLQLLLLNFLVLCLLSVFRAVAAVEQSRSRSADT